MAVTLAVAGSAAAQVASPATNGFVFDGPVNAVLAGSGGSTYVGGQFDAQLRPTAARLVAASPTGAGALAAGVLPAVDGPVSASVDDGAGGLFIGGSFSRVGTTARRNLAHLKADGTLDLAWNPSPNGAVAKLDRIGSQVIALGSFTSAGGRTFGTGGALTGLAVLSATSGVATAFTPAAKGTASDIDAIGDRVYAAGYLTTTGGEYRGALALDLATGALEPWRAASAGGPSQIAVAGPTVVLQDGGSVAGFGAGSGTEKWRVLDANVGDTTLGLTGGRVYVGIFGERPYALDPATGNRVWTAAVAPRRDVIGSTGLAFLQRGNVVYVAGRFDRAGTAERHGAAAFDATTGALLPWDPYLGSPGGRTVGFLNGRIVLGGAFTAGGAPVGRVHDLARVRADGSIDPAFAPGALTPVSGRFDAVTKEVRALALDGSTLYVGGFFSAIGGQVRGGLAAVDTVTGRLTSFAPEGIDTGVSSIQVLPDRIRVVDESGQADFTRAGVRIPDRAGLEQALYDLLGGVDLSTPAGRSRPLGTPEAGAVTGTLRLGGGEVVGSVSGTATGAGTIQVAFMLNDAGTLIKSVYPDFVFQAAIQFRYASDGGVVTASGGVR